jgi:DNA-directed RNA polymerase II subunit RPB2
MTQEFIGRWKNNFLEIHPSMFLGVMANIIPFPDHCPSPRNCYVCSMSKQGLGMYALSHNIRTDTVAYIMSNLQKPLVSTKPAKFMKFDELPSGANAIVAIMCYSGLI